MRRSCLRTGRPRGNDIGGFRFAGGFRICEVLAGCVSVGLVGRVHLERHSALVVAG